MRFSKDELNYGFSFFELPQFHERSPTNLFDLECLKLHVAIRAVWLLYRRGKWDLLESIGLPRALYGEKFLKYDARWITTDHGLLRTDAQAEHFADAVPGVRIAASLLIEEYRMIFSERIVGNE